MNRTLASVVAASLWIAAVSGNTFGQPPKAAPPAGGHAEAMAKLAWLEGTWEGTGSTQQGPGPKEEFLQTEIVALKLEGTALVVEGLGKDPRDGRAVHQALAVMSYDPAAGGYQVAAYKANGQNILATGKFDGDAFQWGFETQGMTIRYTIRRGPAGEWMETGEMSRDGTTWHPFLEMKLTKAS